MPNSIAIVLFAALTFPAVLGYQAITFNHYDNVQIVDNRVFLSPLHGSLELWFRIDSEVVRYAEKNSWIPVTARWSDDTELQVGFQKSLKVCFRGNCVSILPMGFFTPDRWYHVCVTWAQYLRVYLDGDLYASVENKLIGGALDPEPEVELTLGNKDGLFWKFSLSTFSNMFRTFTIEMAEVRLWNSSRSAAQVKKYVNTSIDLAMQSASGDLVGVWRTIDEEGNIVNDVTNKTTFNTNTSVPRQLAALPLAQTLPFYQISSRYKCQQPTDLGNCSKYVQHGVDVAYEASRVPFTTMLFTINSMNIQTVFESVAGCSWDVAAAYICRFTFAPCAIRTLEAPR